LPGFYEIFQTLKETNNTTTKTNILALLTVSALQVRRKHEYASVKLTSKIGTQTTDVYNL